MAESTNIKDRSIEIFIYLLLVFNLILSCITYCGLTDQHFQISEEFSSVIEAQQSKIIELTVRSASDGTKIEKLDARVSDLTAENNELYKKVNRLENGYPFTTVYDLARLACRGYYDVTPELVLAVAYTESRFDPTAENNGAVGIMQVDPKWHTARAERLGISDFKDPYNNLLLGVDYLHEIHQDLINQRGIDDWNYVLMVYNMGHSTAISLYDQGVISDYAKTVMEHRAEYERIFTLLGDI